ncbi:MAG: hypothetical protein GY862_34280 [Gammaproteobacteria bacterium]|nr:hypothetical protein [Gammaproteobacteria bacterium]
MKKTSISACAFLLASGSAWAGTKTGPAGNPNSSGGGGGKTQLNMPVITLEKAAGQRVQTCTAPEDKPDRIPRRILSLALDTQEDSQGKQAITLNFKMPGIQAATDKQVLVLLYSRCLADKPRLKTPRSIHKLALDLDDIEILGTYNVPTAAAPPESGRIGQAAGAIVEMDFQIHLEAAKIGTEMKAGNNKIYMQAGLLNKADFHKKIYAGMLLSPVEAIYFASGVVCPDTVQTGGDRLVENAICKQLEHTKTD